MNDVNESAHRAPPPGDWPAEDLEELGQCPVCGVTERSLLYDNLRDKIFFSAPGVWKMWKCGGCGVGYLDPRPTVDTIGRAYANYYTHGDWQAGSGPLPCGKPPIKRVWHALRNDYLNARYGYRFRPRIPGGRWIMQGFPAKRLWMDNRIRHLPPPKPGHNRLLDAGCGSGYFVWTAQTLGYEAEGLEIDPKACAQARSHGLTVHQGSFPNTGLESESFDEITLSHVLEHLHDPAGALREAFRILRPGGRLWIQVPNLQSACHQTWAEHYFSLDAPRHLVMFNTGNLQSLMSDCGFNGIAQLPVQNPASAIYTESYAISLNRDPLSADCLVPAAPLKRLGGRKKYIPAFRLFQMSSPLKALSHGAGPRISIAMATYNGARYIREQLNSLAAQTLLPCELVVTDDRSTDATLEIVADFASIAPFPVRIHRNEGRLGYADNFLFAASLCEGDLIAFCDQDDVWMAEKLATCVPAFTDQDVLLVIHAAQVTGPDLVPTGSFYPDIEQVNRHLAKHLKQTDTLPHDQVIRCTYEPLQLDPMGIYPGFSMIFRKIVVNFIDRKDRGKDYRFYRENPHLIPHDRWIYLLCCSLGKVLLTEEHLSLYRQHESNTCGLSGPRSLMDKLKSYFAATIYEGRYRNEQHWVGVMETISRNHSGRNWYIANNATNAKRHFEMGRDNDRALTAIYSVESAWSERLFGYFYLLKNAYRRPAYSWFGDFHPVRDFVFGVLGFYLLYRKTKVILLRITKGYRRAI